MAAALSRNREQGRKMGADVWPCAHDVRPDHDVRDCELPFARVVTVACISAFKDALAAAQLRYEAASTKSVGLVLHDDLDFTAREGRTKPWTLHLIAGT